MLGPMPHASGPVNRHLDELLEAARAATSVEAYERSLFAVLEREVGFDVAFCARAGGIGPHAPGFEASVRRQISPHWQAYGREYREIDQASRGQGYVIVDREYFGAQRLERTRVYQDIMRPHHGHSSLLTYLTTRDAKIALVMLGRTRRDFTRDECAFMLRAQALLSVCELASARAASPRASAALTPREHDIVSYLRLGYTNRQIALACGTSHRTVRNQLSRLFEKLEVSTRAEAVARSFELHVG